MIACFRDWEDRRSKPTRFLGSKIANAAFVNNEWRFIGQRERELSLSRMARERENNFY